MLPKVPAGQGVQSAAPVLLVYWPANSMQQQYYVAYPTPAVRQRSRIPQVCLNRARMLFRAPVGHVT
jgi:hypothetical protein